MIKTKKYLNYLVTHKKLWKNANHLDKKINKKIKLAIILSKIYLIKKYKNSQSWQPIARKWLNLLNNYHHQEIIIIIMIINMSH
jgi:hypothetical protein